MYHCILRITETIIGNTKTSATKGIHISLNPIRVCVGIASVTQCLVGDFLLFWERLPECLQTGHYKTRRGSPLITDPPTTSSTTLSDVFFNHILFHFYLYMLFLLIILLLLLSFFFMRKLNLHMTTNMWHLTPYIWHLKPDTWQVTLDIWQTGGVWILSQNVRSLALTILKRRCLKDVFPHTNI